MKNFDWSKIPAYEWKNKKEKVSDEKDTNDFLTTYSHQLNMALKKNEKKEILKIVSTLLDWGMNDDKQASIFAKQIKEVYKIYESKLQWTWNTIDVLDDGKKKIIFDIVSFGKKNSKGKDSSDYHIASWSKILAVYKPNVFYIYDSRVAIGLSVLEKYTEGKNTRIWTIPPARGKNSIFGFISADIKGNKKSLGMRESYCQYLQKLKELSENPEINFEGFNEPFEKMAHVEKMLFMIPQKLVFHVKAVFDKDAETYFECQISPQPKKNTKQKKNAK